MSAIWESANWTRQFGIRQFGMLPLYFNIHQYENKIGYYKHIYFISYFMKIN